MAASLAPIRGLLADQILAAGNVKSLDEANDQIDAFMQWAALIPEAAPGQMYVMLKTPADDAFHALLEMPDQYAQFCDTHLGVRVKHHPLDDHARMNLDGAIEHTVEYLEQVYGDKLHPALRDWRSKLDAGAAIVSCKACSDGDAMTMTVMGQAGDVVLVH